MKITLNSKSWAGAAVAFTGLPGSSLAGKTRSVQQWGVIPAVEGGLVVNDNETISLMMALNEAPRPITINGQTVNIDPALYADGPVCLRPAVIRRVGTIMELVSPGIWSSDPSLGAVHTWDSGWYRNGIRRYKPSDTYEKDGDTSAHAFTFREVRTQGGKIRFQDSNTAYFV